VGKGALCAAGSVPHNVPHQSKSQLVSPAPDASGAGFLPKPNLQITAASLPCSMMSSATTSCIRETAKSRRRVSVSKTDFLKHLKALKFSEADRRELKAAMEASVQVFGYAGGH
jgi:hypothetical protein